jgi:translation initiation factor IF-3
LNSSKLNWRVNEQISAREIRVIDASGKQLGVIDKSKALVLAKEANLDLVEVAPNATPPVVKIIDFGKFRYAEEKKLKKAAKGIKGGEIKEIRFSPFIADNDYATRLARIKEFIEERNKVRVVVVFLGRQMGSKQFGYDVLKRVLSDMGDKVGVDQEPKFLGRHLSMTISPKGVKQNAENQNKEVDN